MFKDNFNQIVKHSLVLYYKSIKNSILFNNNLEAQTIDFANLTNFVALLGGEIKKNQSLSGDMSDIFSNLYLANSILFSHKNNEISEVLTNYCLDRLLNENNIIFNRIIDNYPNSLKYVLYPSTKKINNLKYNDNRMLIKEINENPEIHNNTQAGPTYCRDDGPDRVEIWRQ